MGKTGNLLEYVGHRFRVKDVYRRARLITLEWWRKKLEKASWPKRSIRWRHDVLDELKQDVESWISDNLYAF